MINKKEKILNSNTKHEMYALYIKEKIRRSEEDIKNGRGMSLNEFKQFIDELES